MKNELQKLIERYFRDYLVNDIGASKQTIDTYRYAFIYFMDYMESEGGVAVESLELFHLNRENILNFLKWIETKMFASVKTRNLRLNTFKSFANFIRYIRPEYISIANEIKSIRLKKEESKDITYLKADGIKLLLDQVDKTTLDGLRDYTIIYLMVMTGMRVSEVIELRGKDLSMSHPQSILVRGKGGKIRHIPMSKQLAGVIKKYAEKSGCFLHEKLCQPIFLNHSGDGFTRQGINYIISKYRDKARTSSTSIIPEDLSPHKLRHTTAMALVENGADLIVIRDLLGHSSIQTTEIYAKLSKSRKRKVIEENSKNIVAEETAIWEDKSNVREWLISLGRKRNIM